MENEKKVSLAGIFLVVAVIVIVVMGCVMYMNYSKIAELTSKVNNQENKTEVALESNNDEKIELLSDEELDFFTEYLNKNENNGFLSSYYDKVEDIDVYKALLCGNVIEGGVGVRNEKVKKEYEEITGETTTADVIKYSAHNLKNNFLKLKTGIEFDLEKNNLSEKMIYNKENNSYYVQVAENNYNPVVCISGYKKGYQYVINGEYASNSAMQGKFTVTLLGNEYNKNYYVFVSNMKDDDEENYTNVSDIDDDLVQKLYGYVLKSRTTIDLYSTGNTTGFDTVSFYRNKKTTYSSISNIEKVAILLQNYNRNEIKYICESDVKNIIDIESFLNDDTDNVRCYENLNDKMYEIFNQTNNEWEEYSAGSYFLIYKNDCYYLIGFSGGGASSGIVTYSKIQNVEKDEECIYIYDKFIYIDTDDYVFDQGDKKIHIYTSADKINEIGTEEEDENSSKKLYEKYENKLKTYKHTFKKNSKGEYYWYSTEQCD